MTHVRLFAAATLIAGLLTGCGSDAGFHSPVSGGFADAEALEDAGFHVQRQAEAVAYAEALEDALAPLSELVASDVLIGMPYREALQMTLDVMAHEPGLFFIETYFTVEGEELAMTADLSQSRLRVIVEGGRSAGTVVHVGRG